MSAADTGSTLAHAASGARLPDARLALVEKSGELADTAVIAGRR